MNNSFAAVPVYKGPWINFSHGIIGGATVTLSERAGGLLTAFIATFVTIVGAELWKIICYVSHQSRSKKTPQDGLYHQQQVILRNSATPGGAAWLFLMQAWFWMGKARLSILRTLPWAIFGMTYIVMVGVLAIFSSEISKSPGPQRLLDSSRCGTWALNTSSDASGSAWQSKITNDSLSAASYARSCYGGNNDPLRCGRYVVPSIPWTSNTNASCPFESGNCVYGDTAAVSMTSKMIDSQFDLGINSIPSGRIQLELTTTCAPLRAKNFSTLRNITDDSETGGIVGDKIYDMWYGPITDASNMTYFYNLHSSIDNFGYTLESYYAQAGYPVSLGVFVPVKEINTTQSDLSLLFLAPNSIRFAAQVDDPVFSAHEYVASSVPFYLADYYVSVIGCSEEYRVCNPNNGVCTPKMGNYQLQHALMANTDGLELNARQNVTAYRTVIASSSSSVYHATHTRGGGALRANEGVSQLSQSALPNNQWHIEVGAWFDAGLSRLQALIQEYVTNPSNLVPGSYLMRFDEVPGNIWWEQCYSQLVNDSTDSSSFSVLGLAVLFIAGGLIILASLTMDTVIGFIQNKTKHGAHARMEWIIHDKLQMQRMLYRDMGLGVWHEGTQKIPVTAGRENWQCFPGPAERELDDEDVNRRASGGSDDGAGVQLVGEEHYVADGNKGWRSDA